MKYEIMEGKMQYSREEKARLLKGWKRSGKSISAYVREHGLVRWTFTKWIKADREGEPCFVEVPAPVVEPAQPEAELLIEKGAIKIHIPLVIGKSELSAIMEGLGAAL